MVNPIPAETLEALAAEIGQVAYIDIAKWHLYLNDAKLHTTVAERVYPLLVDDQLSEEQVMQILAQITVKVGGGKRSLPLTDLLPVQSQMDLMDRLEEFQRQL